MQCLIPSASEAKPARLQPQPTPNRPGSCCPGHLAPSLQGSSELYRVLLSGSAVLFPNSLLPPESPLHLSSCHLPGKISQPLQGITHCLDFISLHFSAHTQDHMGTLSSPGLLDLTVLFSSSPEHKPRVSQLSRPSLPCTLLLNIICTTAA